MNQKSYFGFTPLHACAAFGSPEANLSIEILIFHNGNIKTKNKEGQTPILYTASLNSDINTVRTPIDHDASWYDRDGNGKIILHYAAENSEIAVLQYIVKEVTTTGRFSINEPDYNKRTPLFFTQNCCAKSFYQFLYPLKAGANHNVLDDQGNSPKHLCWESHNVTKCPVEQFLYSSRKLGYEIVDSNQRYEFNDDQFRRAHSGVTKHGY